MWINVVKNIIQRWTFKGYALLTTDHLISWPGGGELETGGEFVKIKISRIELGEKEQFARQKVMEANFGKAAIKKIKKLRRSHYSTVHYKIKWSVPYWNK